MKTCFNERKCCGTFVLLACASTLTAANGPENLNPAPLQARSTEPLQSEAVMAFQEKAPLPSTISGDVAYDLNVTYAQSQLWDPTSNRFDAVKLRSYVGASVDPSAPYVAPLIEVYPGQTVRMTLVRRRADRPREAHL